MEATTHIHAGRSARHLSLQAAVGTLAALLLGAAAHGAAFVSDDFASPNLDLGRWTLVDPVGDATVAIAGGELSLAIPGGVSHDVWTAGNAAPRLMQDVDDTDFEVEAKFTTIPTLLYQLQGFLIEQDGVNYLRLDTTSGPSGLRVYAARFTNGSPATLHSSIISPPDQTVYLRVTRSGSQWTLRYSFDGVAWNVATTFNDGMAVSRIGIYAGNAGEAPAFTSRTDYVFNTASPIDPEDGGPVGPDTVPPLMQQVSASAASDTAIAVSWVTDEPATSDVEWGLTPSLELGSLSDGTPVNQHQVQIPSLQPEVTYYVRATSTDGAGNASSSGVLPVTMSPRPEIDLWYGSTQQFGNLGDAQRQINILGNVSDLDGISSLFYSLNGQPNRALTVGPDTYRLENAGDFNADILFDDLITGPNDIAITAVDPFGNQRTETVTVNYPGGNVWPLDYSIDWSTVTDIQDVAQVVDGNWAIVDGTLRPVEIGYDRLVAIGDRYWQNYEVTVPITVNGFDSACLNQGQCPGGGPILGILTRWPGHYESGTQPGFGWWPMGALGAFHWYGTSYTALEIFRGSNGQVGVQDAGVSLPLGVPYMFKMRAETAGGAHNYSLKIWPQGEPEPALWGVSLSEPLSGTASGSLLLLAHFIDASFGNVEVRALADDAAPALSNLNVATTHQAATVTWRTDEPATSAVSYGPTPAYGLGTISDSTLRTEHSVILPALTPESLYHFRVTSADNAGNEASSPDLTFTTDPVPPPDFTSPVISSIQVATTETGATVSWLTDEAADSSVSWGLTDSYELGTLTDGSLVTVHTLALGGLTPGTQYHYRVGSTDASGNAATSADLTFRTQDPETPPGELTADEFDGALDTGLWTIVDPVGDSTIFANGGQVSLSVPAGTSHDVWTSGTNAARVMQGIENADFEIEVKFDSLLSEQYQMHGILIEQDSANFLRFDFYSTGADTRIFAASFSGGTPTIRTNQVVPTTAPLYMRIQRVGNVWIQRWSTDGTSWTPAAVFSQAMFTTAAGVFAGNFSPSSPPAHTALVDYFRIVEPDPNGPDVTPPAIGDLDVALTESSATISWTTDEFSNGRVSWGQTPAYELGTQTDSIFATSHTIVLTGLSPSTTYHFEVGAGDIYGNDGTTGDLQFTTQDPPGPPEADEFDGPLDTSVWTFVDPVGDSSFVANGSQLELSVPAGSAHDIWSGGNAAARVTQRVADDDFWVEAKFDSAVTEQFQLQGILVGQDASNFIRFDFFSTGADTRVFAASFVNGGPTVRVNQVITASVPLYMRVHREGDEWTLQWSADGLNWATAVVFSHAMAVSEVGLYAGNQFGGAGAPAHTALIDHFRLVDGDPVVDTTPPQISGVDVVADETGAVITWQTDEPATSTLAYGTSPAYELGMVADGNLSTSHSVTLTDLAPGTGHHFQIGVTDASGNSATSADQTFSTAAVAAPPTLSGDEFDGSLDTSLWTYVDPVGDGSVDTTGTQLSLSVPGGTTHDVWRGGNRSVRVMQATSDEDFTVEVKFDSAMSQQFQLQGLIIEQDGSNFIRADFFSVGGNDTRIFAATFAGGGPSVRFQQPSSAAAPMYMRITRQGDQWTVERSSDGSAWVAAGSFSYALQVSSVGVFAGNAGGGAPAHTALVDYFRVTTP